MDKNGFKSAWWLPNSHCQTIWPVLCRPKLKLPLTRERFELPDGDFVDLDWLAPQPHKVKKLVIILHGLEGSVRSHYAQGMLKSCSNHGWQGLFMHFRGCSGEPNRFPHDYHSGKTEDLACVVKALEARYPGVQIAIIGYSLGGNVLLKWLGETSKSNPLKAAIAVSVPFGLHKAAYRIRQGFSKVYQWYFIKCLCARLKLKFKTVTSPLADNILDEIRSMTEFDDKVTAPLHGFNNADDYYSQASSRQFLHSIQVPTLILHAKDDPFMSEDIIPTPRELSDKVQLEVSEQGGHVGFISGNLPWRPEYWLEQRVPKFVNQYFFD